MTQQKEKVDVAKYAKVELKEKHVTLQWEEPRDIYKVSVEFANEKSMPSPDEVKLQYWQNSWPQTRFPKGEKLGASRSGWMAQDDWFNGEWKNADVNVKVEGNSFIYTFNPINSKEFPDEEFDAVYRRTLKIRLVFEDSKPEIESIKAYTDSVWKETELKVEWGDDFAKEDWQGHFEIYNGELENVDALTDNVTVDEKGNLSCDGKAAKISLRLRYAYNEDVNSFDKTIITLRSTAESFSFLIDDVESGGKIFVKDFDTLVTKAADDIDYAKFRKEWESNHPKTLYDRIKELPEQTLQNAINDMPERKRFYIVLGCEGGRQKFGVDPNGDVFCPENWIRRIKGKDSDRLLWEGREIRYSFGFPDVEPTERHIEEGYLPIIHTKWEDDNVVYEQTAFATLLGTDILSGERMQGDDPTILLAKVTLTNSGNDLQTVNLNLKSKCDVEEKLVQRDGFVFATNYEPNRMRYFVDISEKGVLKSEDGKLSYEINLAKNESHSIYFKIPFITLTEEKEYELAKNADYESEFVKVKKFWQDRISEGAQIKTPDQTLNNFYRAHLVHMLITDDREPGEERYMPRCGSLGYGVFANEGCMVISDLDRRGYLSEASKHLETFIHYQGTKLFPGNFSSKDGLFYGAGGYESGAYNQHHGWVLWALGEHYWYSRDEEWLRRVAPSIVKGCDWIIRERKNTKKLDENGEKVLEYGFLPAGALEDVTEYWYWLATNAYTYFGFNNAALALADINHPDGERLVEEAKKYKEDLLRGFSESMIRAPVVKLRDGTYVPHFLSRLYRRGRSFGWIRETLEGAIHLIRCGLLESSSKEATWIIKDFEDNLYLSSQYGLSVPDFEKYWFSRGGFCTQPNLLPHPIPYLLRDEPKHFLRGYFNAFAVAFYPDTCLLTEWLPTMEDWGGDHYKTSDEAQSTYWLRLMLIFERGEELCLGMMTPRGWLENGKEIKVENALTYFGRVGFFLQSRVADDEISIILKPPRRNPPKSIKVRFRHPDKKDMKRVTVNGEEWSDFDVKEELITLEPKILKDENEIVAYY